MSWKYYVQSVIAANLGNERVSPGMLLQPISPSGGILRGWTNQKQRAPGWSCQCYCQTNSDKLTARETSNSRHKHLEKRKGKIQSGTSSWGRWQAQDLPFHWHQQHLGVLWAEIGEESTCKRASREHVMMDGGWYVVSWWSWAGRRYGMWSSRHFIAFRIFLVQFGIVVIAKYLYQCLKKA